MLLVSTRDPNLIRDIHNGHEAYNTGRGKYLWKKVASI
jgi:hypothetical protein